MESSALINWLISNASYDAPLAAQDIAEKYPPAGKSLSAVTEKLKELVDIPQLLGVIVREREGKYYAELPLSEEDIVILKAALLGIPYYEDFHQNEVIERLNSFIPEYMRETDSIKPRTGKYNGTFYRNISEIIKAIYPADYDETHTMRVLFFNYCDYDSSKELIPRTNRNGDTLKAADPLKIVCVNNLFYLVTFYEKDGEIHYINYRIDKMTNVRCSNKPAKRYSDYITDEEKYYLRLKQRIEHEKAEAQKNGKIYEGSGADIAAEDSAKYIDRSGFNLGEYIQRSPIMFNDKVIEKVIMTATKGCIGRLIDTFGFEPDITDISETEISVTLYNISLIVVKNFALQYYSEVEVIEPPSVREELGKAIDALTRKYGGTE